ncbi:Bardet-Biedl syndrome 1 protein isoform X2 [Plodia interpunctella]|uniref:Bardet-Biedl syndrome 1 protein isoform X2 n=1 Tax=Plodia interpunctella TaxID=58824 RepID=UPI002367BAEA|nr:Bardet-Biedl syndrome 1 protein isoform X2 [Plodia interpunctella]
MSMTRWLDVEVGTDEIEINSLPSNLALVDVNNDKEVKLIIGDIGKGEDGPKLKVFKGTMQISDQTLPDLPLGLVGLYASDAANVTPVIAVAFSSCVYVFRNFKIFYKYYLPSFELSTCEMEVWKQLTNPSNHNLDTMTSLTENLKAIPAKILTAQSRDFLAMSPEEQLDYLEQLTETPSSKVPEIACVTTLRLHSVEKHAMACLVIGTEDGEVVIIEPQTFTVVSQAKVCSVKKTPYQMVTTGLYSVDYRITIATREKCVCILKREWTEGRLLFATEEHIIAIEVMHADNTVMVICADNTMACYSKKGKKQWSLNLEHRPVAMTLVPVVHLGLTLVGVALASGHVQLYDGKAKRDTIFVRDVVSVMKFGQLGQEEHVLIIVTGSGNLMLKILKRTADFNGEAAGLEAPQANAKPWLIPKKSKLFIEQSVRERENAVAMHETFQLELNRLRLLAAKTLLEAHLKSDNSIAVGAMEPVKMTAEVEGLGPVFRVALIIENTSTDKAVIGLSILFHVHTTNYKVSNPYIKVLLLKAGQCSPVLAATVQMPPTDPMLLPYDKMQGDDFQQDLLAV